MSEQKKLRIIVPLVIEVDREKWYAEFGGPEADRDIREHVGYGALEATEHALKHIDGVEVRWRR